MKGKKLEWKLYTYDKSRLEGGKIVKIRSFFTRDNALIARGKLPIEEMNRTVIQHNPKGAIF